MDPALRQATLAAQNIQSPSSPLGASSAPELATLYQSSFQLPQATAAAGAAGEIASQQVAEAKRAAAEAAARAKQRESDMQNISKYRAGHVENGKFVPGPKPDGGFDFYDPDGKQVDIATLTKNTGVNAADYLDKLGSKNPMDLQYINEYKNLNGLLDALGNNDQKRKKFYIDQAKSAGIDLNPYLKNRGDGHKLLDAFYQSFKRYYVPRTEDPNAWGAPNKSLIPTSGSSYKSSSSSSDDLINTLKQYASQGQ